MLTAFRRNEGPNLPMPNRFTLLRIFSRVLTLLWVGTLSGEFFPARYILFVTAAALVIAFAIFYRRLERSYRWFEERFLSTFETQEAHSSAQIPFGHLAPWDAHLVTMEIHPNSRLVMKTISEAALRVRYGVNIVAIQRGRSSIVTPLPREVLLPKDQLILLGTDEQVEQVKAEMEPTGDISEAPAAAIQYELRQTKLTSNSTIISKTIRQSGIREQFGAMVVGIERGGIRSINPDSDLILLENDLLWIAGEKHKLNSLITALSADHSDQANKGGAA